MLSVQTFTFEVQSSLDCRKRPNGEIHGDVVAVASGRVRRKKEIPQLPP
jgi:hypothetical protein